jgi:hypothetical protein
MLENTDGTIKNGQSRESERDLTPDVIEEEGEIKDNFKENVKPESRGLDDELVRKVSCAQNYIQLTLVVSNLVDSNFRLS